MPTPLLPLVDTALRGALLATLLLLGAAFARGRAGHAVPRVGVALTAGLALQLVGSLPAIERGWPIAWQAPLVAVSVGNAVLFWLFARTLFDDAFRLRRAHPVIWLAVASVGAGFCGSMAAFGPHAAPTLAFRLLLRTAPVVFAAMVLVAAASHWRGDLIEPRRRLRAFVVVAGAAYALGMVGVRITAAHGVPSAAAALLDTAGLLAISLTAALALLRLREDGGLWSASPVAEQLVPPLPRSDEPSLADPDPLEARLAADLDRLMTVDRAYRIDDLTLGVLALKLNVPEYRLRRFIHERLGQRHFNAYLNGLRLADVRAALVDPGRVAAGVLELALEAGFASVGPFNRAFKAETGLTPTEFRRRALADS